MWMNETKTETEPRHIQIGHVLYSSITPNPVFSETNEVINLTSSAGETSFLLNEDDDDEENITNNGARKVTSI